MKRPPFIYVVDDNEEQKSQKSCNFSHLGSKAANLGFSPGDSPSFCMQSNQTPSLACSWQFWRGKRWHMHQNQDKMESFSGNGGDKKRSQLHFVHLHLYLRRVDGWEAWLSIKPVTKQKSSLQIAILFYPL